jgi:autotransporter-associated beta strand protein
VDFLSARRWLALFSLILCGSSGLYGQNTWISRTTTSSWFSGDNWSLESPPTSNESAVVDNGTTAQIPTPPEGTSFAAAATLTIGATTAGSKVQLIGGNLGSETSAVNIIIGPQGTLEFSGGFAFGAIQDNGTMLFDTVPNQVLSGASGSGRIIINGIALTLNGENTFSGITTISANGSLQIGTGGMFGSIGGNITNNGTLIFDRSDSFTFAGVISGAGSVQQIGSGTTVLTGTNSYTGGTTIAAGTLQLGNGGTTGGITGNVMDAGILAFDRSDLFTFGGVISGTGSVRQIGSGTTVLTGTNSYTGGTTISAGTLQLGNGGTTGSITGNVIDDGILAFDRTDVFTFGGVISGTGNVRQIGSGTTVLTGTNSYIGETTIAAGTLQLGNGGSSGSISGNVIDNGILAFNRSEVLSFSGAISGTGGVTQIGPGTTILAGSNSYSGATTVTSGTLQAGSANGFSPNSAFTVNSILDLNGFSNTIGSISGTGTVLNNGTTSATLTAGARNENSTFSGVLADGISVLQLVKSGSGALILTGNNTYTGTTTVNGGSLIVDGSISSVQALVNASGLLGGRGLIGGNLTNSGIVSPGDSPGTLTVSGNYSQSSTGTLQIEIAGLGAGQHDLLAVGGHATLGGTVKLIRLGSFQLQPGDKVTFLTAGGGISGNFSTIQNDFGTIVKTQVIISPNAVVLQGTQGSFTEVAMTPNCVAVARALDSAVGDPRAAALINFLNSEPLSRLCPVDFNLIAPDQLTSVFNIGVSLANIQSANLERQMDNIHAGGTGFNSAGFSLNGAPSYGGGLGGPTGPEGKSGPSVLAPIPENRWGVFVSGLGEFTHVDSTDTAHGFDLQTGGVTFGVDYRIGSNFAIGLMAGYAHTNADLANSGDIDVNSGNFGLYATAFTGGFYLDTALTGGVSGYDTRRTALLGTASGSTNGGDLNVLVNGGYDWKRGGLSIGPTASFQYTYVSFDGFTESGSLAPLKINDQHVDSIRTAFGMKASYDWKIGNVVVRPELRAAWQHEYGDSAYSIAASFANGAGGSFTVSSPKIGRDSLLLGAGIAVIWSDRISTYVYYDGELARTNYQSNNISAGIRVTF